MTPPPPPHTHLDAMTWRCELPTLYGSHTATTTPLRDQHGVTSRCEQLTPARSCSSEQDICSWNIPQPGIYPPPPAPPRPDLLLPYHAGRCGSLAINCPYTCTTSPSTSQRCPVLVHFSFFSLQVSQLQVGPKILHERQAVQTILN